MAQFGVNGLFGSVRSRPNWQNQSSKRAGSECRVLISLRVYALRVRENKAPTLTPETAKPLNPEGMSLLPLKGMPLKVEGGNFGEMWDRNPLKPP